jgi:predicted nucleic acid-binding protein
MNFLLDTNVVSEWVKPQPNLSVIAWLDEVDEDRVFLSVITLTELRYGIARLAAGKRRKRLEDWLKHELPLRFEGRVLDIDPAVANACGELMARQETIGRRLEAMDAYLAATAEVYGMTLVTRNDTDFEGIVSSLNPWHT